MDGDPREGAFSGVGLWEGEVGVGFIIQVEVALCGTPPGAVGVGLSRRWL